MYTWRIDTGSAGTARFEIIGTLTVDDETAAGDEITSQLANAAHSSPRSTNYISHGIKIYDYTGGTRGDLLYDITEFDNREWFRYDAGSPVFNHQFERTGGAEVNLRGTAQGGTHNGDFVVITYIRNNAGTMDTWRFNRFKDASGTDVTNFTAPGVELARFSDNANMQIPLTRRFEWSLGSAASPINGFGDTSGNTYYVIGEIRTQSTNTTITQADAIYHTLSVYENGVLNYTVDMVNETVAIGTGMPVAARTGNNLGSNTFTYNTSTNRFVGNPQLLVEEGTGDGPGSSNNHSEAGIRHASGGDYVIPVAGDSGLLVNTTGSRAFEGRELLPI